MDVIDKIIAFEAGDLDEAEVIALFQELVDSGLINQLQGSYQRAAARLVDAGVISLSVAT